MVCRYSGWISVYQAKDLTAKELVTKRRENMGNFGVMDELASDGATVYTSVEVQEFLDRFGVKHKVSSAYKPHSNQLAEGAVKSAKRMLEDNTWAQGTLDNDKFLAAQLAHGPREHSLQQPGGVRKADQGPLAPPAWETEG